MALFETYLSQSRAWSFILLCRQPGLQPQTPPSYQGGETSGGDESGSENVGSSSMGRHNINDCEG